MKATELLYQLFLKHPTVVTDSRKIIEGCLFFALKGENFNGNKFAEDAINKGAAYAIIDEKIFKKTGQFILVEDVLTALQNLAEHYRKQFQIPVIGITGSNGKTTTKELISTVLSSHYRTHFTKGNFNNHIGVPLTLLAMPKDTEVAIIEMGANHIGEIEFLCEIAQPTHGLITNIGKAHLEGFGGIEGVKKGKSELYKFLANNKGVAFINKEEPFLEKLAEDIKWKIFYKQGETPSSDKSPFEIQLLKSNPFISAVFSPNKNPVVINSQLIGLYNFNNVMTAATLGIYFKVPSKKIKQAIEDYIPSNNRSQIVKINSNTFILDAYNANPTSMKNALQNFSKIEAKNKIAILGAMKELGDYAQEEHKNIFELAESYKFDKIILVGKEFDELHHPFYKNVEELNNWFKQQKFENTYFLIKGSRSVRLEKTLEVFK